MGCSAPIPCVSAGSPADDTFFFQAIAHIVGEAIERWQSVQYTAIQYDVTRITTGPATIADTAPTCCAPSASPSGGRRASCGSSIVQPPSCDVTARGMPPPCRQGRGRHSLARSRLPGASGFPVASGPAASRSTWWISPRIRLPERYGPGSGKHLASGFGFPALGDEEVIGVVTCFSSALRAPARTLLGLFDALGQQIGGFLRREEIEEESAEAEALARQRERLADIGALTARIVHDVGNPLAGLSMLTQRIARRLERDPSQPLGSVQDVVEQLIETTRRLDVMIHDSRASRASSGWT